MQSFEFELLQKLSVNLEGVGVGRQQAGLQASPSRQHKEGAQKEGVLSVQLAEVCLDMMARYTYSNLSTLPSR